MRIIFSKDRPAQLDLLLRSLERYGPAEKTTVIWTSSDPDFLLGYLALNEEPAVAWEREDWVANFQVCLRTALAADETATFFCDDDVLYRPIDEKPAQALADETVLTFSLRLCPNDPQIHFSHDPDGDMWWHWSRLDPHDHGYPGSIDGHTFRTEDLRRMLDGQTIENPLMLETILAQRVYALAEERPLMACYPEQKLVGIDVNAVAEQRGNPAKKHAQSAEELNRRFLAGERISLDGLDFSGVDGCLVSLPFVWEPA